ncbi:MAG: hypothetical protein ACRC46_12630 [Thermoguttaceae bacterium]
MIRPNGLAVGLYHDSFEYATLGRPQIRRASHVEPTDDGSWTADLSCVHGPVLGPFAKRSEALAAEIEFLNAMITS